MSQELSDEEIAALRHQFGITSDGRGIKEWAQVQGFARAIIAADRAKRVPMTPRERLDAMLLAEERLEITLAPMSFAEGIRAAEAFHGIGSKT